MTRLNDSTVDAGPASAPTSRTHRARGLVGTGLTAAVAAMAATTAVAALARAVGVAFEVPAGGETIPLTGDRGGDRLLLPRGRGHRRRSAPVERSAR
jgi:hypothetical protein